jgi:restriction system protein
MGEIIVWGIHAGRTGDADTLFLKKKCIGIGWATVEDLSKISPDREAFKAKVAEAYPEKKRGAIPNNAGQLFRFVHEMKLGDIILYPSKRDRMIHIGKVVGAYSYNPSLSEGYPNIREVDWLKALPRTHFTQGALYEIGSAMSLFQVKTYSEEFLSALTSKESTQVISKDETVSLVVDDIEETTRDFILKRLAQEIKGHPFAEFVAHLLETMGYRTRLSPPGPDGGVDIVAHKDELGFEPPIIKVQVKSSENSISNPVVSALYGNVEPNEYGLLVTLGTFGSQAKTFARNKSNLRLIDGDELVDLIFQHYEQFNSKYKGLLPLKQVYIPEVLENETE